MAKRKSTGTGGNGGQFKKDRRPHNAKVLSFENAGDLVRILGAESKIITINGREVEMSSAERSLRLTVERAINGNVRDIAEMLRLMIKHPRISGRGRTRRVLFLGGLGGVVGLGV